MLRDVKLSGLWRSWIKSFWSPRRLPSIKAEFDQLVMNKTAVRQITKDELHQLAQERGLPIEVLPGKMVHARKAGSGAYCSRAAERWCVEILRPLMTQITTLVDPTQTKSELCCVLEP
jgi:hypothetical protein